MCTVYIYICEICIYAMFTFVSHCLSAEHNSYLQALSPVYFRCAWQGEEIQKTMRERLELLEQQHSKVTKASRVGDVE